MMTSDEKPERPCAAIRTIGIVTVIRSVELASVLLAFGRKMNDRPDQQIDGCRYWIMSVNSADGQPIRVVVTCVGESGNTYAVEPTSQLIRAFDPDFMILSGIACGVRDFRLGDVVTGKEVRAYEYAKSSADGFMDRSRTLTVDSGVSKDVTFYSSHKYWHRSFNALNRTLSSALRPRKANRSPTLHDNIIIASGDKVMANGELGALRAKHNSIKAGEMEGHGFATACTQARKDWLVVRGISDFGDKSKDGGDDSAGPQKDEFHFHAALAAATFTRSFIEDGLTWKHNGTLRKEQSIDVRADNQLLSNNTSYLSHLVSTIENDLIQWASTPPTDDFATRLRFWRILQNIHASFGNHLEFLRLPVRGTNIMLLRRQIGATSEWTIRLTEGDLHWDNEKIWMCIALENERKDFVRSHEFSKYYIMLRDDINIDGQKKRLGLNGRTLQDLLTINSSEVLSLPDVYSIERHADAYNASKSIGKEIDCKFGYGIRFSGDYDLIYQRKSSYLTGLSASKVDRVRAILNVPIFASDHQGRASYVLGTLNVDFFEPVVRTEDVEHLACALQKSLNHAFRTFVDRAIGDPNNCFPI